MRKIRNSSNRAGNIKRICRVISIAAVLALFTGSLYCLDEATETTDEEMPVFEAALEEESVDAVGEENDIEIVYSPDLEAVKAKTKGKVIDISSGSTSSGSNSIIYELNGGVNNAKNPEKYSTKKDTALKKPTKTGYKFAGWYDNSDFTGKKISKVSKKTVGNITLYAKWTAVKYSIKYTLSQKGVKTKGAKNSKNNLKKYTIEDEVILEPATSKNFDFEGWYSDKALTKKVTYIPQGSTGNISLFAKWGKTQAQEKVDDIKPDKFEQKVIDGINKYRREAGRKEVKVDSELMKAARLRAKECAENVYWITWADGSKELAWIMHDRPDLKRRWYTIAEDIHMSENRILLAENGNKNSGDNSAESWRYSPGHYNNMIKADATLVGVGYAKDKYDNIYCYMINGRYKTTEEIEKEEATDKQPSDDPWFDTDRDDKYTLSFDINGGIVQMNDPIPDTMTLKFGDTESTLPDGDFKKWDSEEEEWLELVAWSVKPNSSSKSDTFKPGVRCLNVATSQRLKDGDSITLYAIYE